MTPRGRTRLKIWLVVAGVFALGCLTGALLDGAYRQQARAGHPGGRPRRDRGEVFERMKRDLNLSEQQATEIRAILDQTHSDYRALRSEVRPRYDALRQNSRARIRSLLTPEQQRRFDEKIAERDARRGKEDDEK